MAASAIVSVAYEYNGLGQRVLKTTSRYGLPPCLSTRGVPLQMGSSAKNAATATSKSAAPDETIIPVPCNTWTTTNTVRYVYDDQSHLIGEYDSTTGYSQETVWFNGQPVATVQNGQIYYITADNLGTPRSIVRPSDGAEVWRWDSDPFGTTLPTSPNPAAGTLVYNLRFPGQIYDEETGFHYNGMREYVPWTGRYLEADPIGLGGGLSRYAYVAGNPLSSVDPYGMASLVGQIGGSFVPGFGGEGYLGGYITLPSSGVNFDIGVYASGGVGPGYNAGSAWGVGFVTGNIDNISGITYNVKAGISPAGGTLMFDATGLVGFTFGPAIDFGLSGTYAQTGAIGLSTLGHWLENWLFNKSNPAASTCP